MAIKLVIPSVGESVTEVELGEWLKKAGDTVSVDEPIVEIESDKATVEILAPEAGTITEILKQTGEAASVGDVVGMMEAGEVAVAKPAADSAPVEPVAAAAAETKQEVSLKVMPAAMRLIEEHGLDAAAIEATGSGGRIIKGDVLAHIEKQKTAPAASAAAAPAAASGLREEESVRMSPMRRKISEHLVNAQLNAALLTTFNEVDMSAVMALRAEYKDKYSDQYGVRLGFMSFFVKACIEGLKAIPEVNAEVRDENIIYRNYYDIGVAVGGPKGLVVPVLRNTERMSFAEIESGIGDFGRRAQDNKISLEELQGGTFTISNGGTYGSLLSTPIVNAPQSGILGMHKIEKRPVVVNDEIVIRPMMYLALTYDHRVVDGKGAVTFLVRVKECIENPTRILLEI